MSTIQNFIKKTDGKQRFPFPKFPNPYDFFPPIPPPSVEVVHKIYIEVLDNLTLPDNLRRALNQKGVSDAVIEKIRLRQIPSEIENLVIISEISKKYQLAGVAGFERTQNGGWRLAIDRKWGVICAVKDSAGNIRCLRLFRSLNDSGVILKTKEVA